MKDVKKYYGIKSIVITAVAILCVLGIYLTVNVFDKSYAETAIASDDTYYQYVDRFESYYRVRYLKEGRTERSGKDNTGYMRIAVNGNTNNILNVYCAFRGKALSTDVDYYRYNFDQFYSSYSVEWRTKLANIVMLYEPNSSISTLKNYLQTNYPTEYQRGGLSELTEAEAAVAFQSAVWVFTNNDSDYNAVTDDDNRNNRINTLHEILLQEDGYLKNISSGSGDNPWFSVNFYLNQDLALNSDTGKYEASLITYNPFNQGSDAISLKLTTNSGTVIPSSSYTVDYLTNGTGKIMNIVFNDNVFESTNDGFKLRSNNELFDSIYITITVNQPSTSKSVFVYVAEDSNYQNFLGIESLPVTSNSYVNLSVPESSKVRLEIDKVDDENLSGNSISNAYLRLYRVEGNSDVLIDAWLTSQNKKVINDLLPGTYKIVETLYPEGYENSRKSTTVNANSIYVASGKEFTLTDDYETYYVNVMNKQTEIKFRKMDNTLTNYLEGAVFAIIDFEGVEYYRITTTKGEISLKNELDSGTYFLVELEAPTNYIKSNIAYRFKVGNVDDYSVVKIVAGEYKNATIVDANYNSSTNVITITNEPGLSISKKSIDDSAVYVVGATLQITNSKGEVVDRWVTTSKDHIVTVKLEDGIYTLTETIPGPGYATAESIQFEIKDGKVANNQDINMKDAPLDVCIAKKAANVSGNLAGAKFELYDQNNKLITSFTSTNQAHCFPVSLGLTPGTYTLKEVKAPNGYVKSNDTTVVIRDTDELQLFEVINEVSVPITDLNTSTIIYIAMIIMGTVGIGLVCYYVKRYNY